MPATAVLQQLLQPLCCCSDPDVDVKCGMNPLTKKPHMASYAARKGGEPKAAPHKEAPKGPTCAPCGHQDAIKKIRERHGENPPHLATTMAGGRDLSV